MDHIIRGMTWVVKRGISNENCDSLIVKEIDDKRIEIKDENVIHRYWNMTKDYIPTVFQGRRLIGPHDFYLLRHESGEKHRDEDSVDKDGNRTYLTVFIYLNDYKKDEGILLFEEKRNGIYFVKSNRGSPIKIVPKKGDVMIMWHKILHQNLPIKQGVRYVLRYDVCYEKFGESGWYDGPSRPELKEEDIPYPGHDRPQGYGGKVYGIIPVHHGMNFIPGRLPKEGEDRCENCYEILDLMYDYYKCPGCNMPVIYTKR